MPLAAVVGRLSAVIRIFMSTESEFLQQVKDILGHLYDYPYLENHPLALRYWPEPEQSGPHRAQRLSRLLLESIEALHPPDTSAKGASRTEYYLLLVYRYIEEWPLPNIMRELGYSRRQFFRQQQKAIEMLAGSLWERAPQPKSAPTKLDNVLDDELERFRTRHRAVDIQEVVQGVLEMVGQLAEQHQVILSCDLPAGLPVIYGSRTLLRQIFLTALSQLITHTSSQQIHLRLSHTKQRVGVELTAEFDSSRPEAAPHDRKPGLEPLRRLVELMKGNWQTFELNLYGCTCRFDFPAGATKVLLVVDDNEAVSQAFGRYLVEYGYQIAGATNGTEALQLARELNPALITLDVMIPGQDGWEILHALKHNPATRHIPVIICSVLEDPELARSLGAAGYLQKPVAQADLLAVLERMVDPA
ncbi:MAG TPA: response regulator [Anaerolineae bacterium]|nr:response regulator [Anaerolineae bacterium]